MSPARIESLSGESEDASKYESTNSESFTTKSTEIVVTTLVSKPSSAAVDVPIATKPIEVLVATPPEIPTVIPPLIAPTILIATTKQ